MAATTDPAARKAFIDGLRALARFLVAHPNMPVPSYGADILFSDSGTADPRGFVDEFAAMTGAEVSDCWETSGHYDASRSFGPIAYKAYAVSDAAMAAHRALSSYTGSVLPEAAPLDEAA